MASRSTNNPSIPSQSPAALLTLAPITRWPTPPLLGGPRLARWPGPHTGGQTRLEWERAQLAADDGVPTSEAGLYTNQDPTAVPIPRELRISRWLAALPERPSLMRRNTEGSLRTPHPNAQYAAAGVPPSETLSDGVVSWVGLTVPRWRKRDAVKRFGSRLFRRIRNLAKRRFADTGRYDVVSVRTT